MRVTIRRLSLGMIENCQEVQTWLDQFPKDNRMTATNLLLRLQFVTRDTYAEWLKATICNLTKSPLALFAVRKFDSNIHSIWDTSGKVVGRPSSSQGSEDLVHSVISNLIKSGSKRFLDHPNLQGIKSGKVHDIVLIDDSIGSGKRIYGFIQRMMKNKTFLSWWSLGWIRLHIVAFARTIESTKRIIEETPGSDHPIRKHPKSKKIDFTSHLLYQESRLDNRWGRNYQSILDLCQSQKAIPPERQMGFGGTMANIVFYHSVPNNTPGLLWFERKGWAPLFPRRSVPEWLPRLLEGRVPIQKQIGKGKIPAYLLDVLRLVKKGIRNESSLARVIGLDTVVLKEIVLRARASGFITVVNRLTVAGEQVIRKHGQRENVDCFDRSLYIPKVWCVGGGTVQPSEPQGETPAVQTDSTDGTPLVDGEAG